jgi:polyhydroxybutyrate depolymerase
MLATRLLLVIPAILCCEIFSAEELKLGTHDLGLKHDGRDRTYLLHVPPQYDGTKALPLVMFFHGGMGTAKHGEKNYGWSEKADKEGFFVVYANGTGSIQTWNAMHGCGSAFKNKVDDVGFVKVLLQELNTKVKVDPKRVYSTGMSNGAMLTHRLAAELSELIAATGAIGGKENSEAPEKRIPAPQNPVPMIIIHGKEDQNVRYEGGQTNAGAEKERFDLSVADAVAFWTKANGCAATATKEVSKDGNIIKESYASESGADVVLYTIVDGGHAWPGSTSRARFKRNSGNASNFSATDAAWEFFASHPKK